MPSETELNKGAYMQLLWGFYVENLNSSRRHEDLREKMTGFVITFALGLLGLLSLKESGNTLVPPVYLTSPLIVLGLFGALISRKHYERNRMHGYKARAYREELEKLYPGIDIDTQLKTAKKEHKSKYKLTSRTHLNWLWTVLHLIVAFLGVVLSLLVTR